ncbi:MAG: hypothetical protein Q9185_004673 [Variospora sp. 1 TL-2023]
MSAMSPNLGMRKAAASDSDRTSIRDTSLAFNSPFPHIPGFEMSFTLDHKRLFRPSEIYQTGIQLMYELAQREWTEIVLVMVVEQIANLNVLMMLINPQSPDMPHQLQVMHCVSSLYRALNVMTDGVIFCQLRSQLSLRGLQIGALSITPVVEKLVVAADDPSMSLPDVPGELGMDSGQIIDEADRKFVINYRFYGKPINSKEVSMGIVEAMATATPFSKDAECKELEAISPDGGCGIFIESMPNNRQIFTYKYATKALKLLYQKIIVPQKRFGDIYLDLRYDGQPFGQLRMLKFVSGAQNFTDRVAEGR